LTNATLLFTLLIDQTVESSEIFDFLVDILPREKIEDGAEGEPSSNQDPTGEEDRPHKRARLDGDEVEDDVNVDEGVSL
jgi:hypothetical protein